MVQTCLNNYSIKNRKKEHNYMKYIDSVTLAR